MLVEKTKENEIVGLMLVGSNSSEIVGKFIGEDDQYYYLQKPKRMVIQQKVIQGENGQPQQVFEQGFADFSLTITAEKVPFNKNTVIALGKVDDEVKRAYVSMTTGGLDIGAGQSGLVVPGVK